uniref:Uncharacterized protein n=1 Tax=Arundo donax TaxID=35708 RepID=A0A0A8XP33_ARUDO
MVVVLVADQSQGTLFWVLNLRKRMCLAMYCVLDPSHHALNPPVPLQADNLALPIHDQ